MKNLFLFCFFSFFSLLSKSFSQEVSYTVLGEENSQLNASIKKVYEPKGESRALSLKEVLEEGLRKNPEERVRDFDRQLLQLSWEDTYQSFWYPQLRLRLGTNQDQRIGRLYRGDRQGSSPTSSSPSGFFGLEFEDYTIFNWGKDYLTYLNLSKLQTRLFTFTETPRRTKKRS